MQDLPINRMDELRPLLLFPDFSSDYYREHALSDKYPVGVMSGMIQVENGGTDRADKAKTSYGEPVGN